MLALFGFVRHLHPLDYSGELPTVARSCAALNNSERLRTMLHFCLTIHARPAAALPGPAVQISGQSLATLAIAPATLAATLFDCTFEAASERLESLERMFLEPDGSFVWTSSQRDQAWQVDGNLYDRAQRLAFVDLNGCCPSEDLDRLLSAFGWPQTALVFQLTREAVVLDEPEFRRFAARAK